MATLTQNHLGETVVVELLNQPPDRSWSRAWKPSRRGALPLAEMLPNGTNVLVSDPKNVRTWATDLRALDGGPCGTVRVGADEAVEPSQVAARVRERV